MTDNEFSCVIRSNTDDLPKAVASIRIGERGTPGDPNSVVLVCEGASPRLRIDVYFPVADYHFTVDAVVWAGWIAVGFGARVVLVSLDGSATRAISLSERRPPRFADYFCQFHSAAGFLLACSGTTVSRIEPDGTVRWKSEALAVDGVLIGDADDVVIEGSGEWDPPGGWRPFRLSAKTGIILPGSDSFPESMIASS